MANKKFLLLIVLSAIIFTGLIGAITFSNIFPTTTPYVTSSSTVNLSYGINAEDGLSSITHSWNGTNTTLYDSSLVLFMNFDNRSALGENDTIVKDLSISYNNGSCVAATCPSWASDGKYNGDFVFDLNKDFISIPDADSLDTNATTISLWIKPEATSTAVDVLSKFGTSPNKSYSLYFTACKPLFYITSNGTGSAGDVLILNSNTVINDNAWHNVVFTYNLTNASLYVDNVLKATSLWAKGINPSPSNIEIAKGTSIQYKYFNGSIDDLMIFNRSLTQAEITDLYNSQITKYNTTYWEYNISNKVISESSVSSFICSKNGTANEFCSATQTSRELFTLKSNFSTSLTTINNNFYGTNTHGNWGGEEVGLGIYANSTRTLTSDYQWHRNALLNSGISYLRGDGNFDTDAYENRTFKQTSPSNTFTVNSKRTSFQFACENKMRYLFNLKGMPNWLYDNSSGVCETTAECLSGVHYCECCTKSNPYVENGQYHK